MDFNSIAQNLLKLCKEIDVKDKDTAANPFSGQYFQTLFRDKHRISLKKDGLPYLIHASQDFLDKKKHNQKLSELISTDFVKTKLIEISINAILDHSDKRDIFIIEELKQFFADIKISEYLYYTGIGNLIVQKEYNFGLITIFPNTKESIETHFHGDSAKKRIVDQLIDNSKSQREGKIYSIAEVSCNTADFSKGTENARLILRQHLNVLQSLYNEGLFIEGDPTRDSYHYLIFDVDEQTFGMSGGNKKGGNYYNPFIFDQFVEQNEVIIKKLDSSLKSPSEDSLQQKIIFSLDWLGDSLVENNHHHRLIKLMISLESLLLDDHDSTKRFSLEERAAFLYSKQYEGRIYAKDLVNKSYLLRNGIVHTGNKKLISSELLTKVSHLILHLNLKILLDPNYVTIADIKGYVEKEKYGFSEVRSK